ncbi:MAG: HlyD family secretion protein, partial [Omnitrophica WOR_2 bacterium]
TAAPADTSSAFVDATGSVRTKQSATLSWQASGTVGSIKVKPGDPVKAGDMLANLDPASLPANIISAQSSLVTAQQALDNLQQSNTPHAQAKVDLLNAQQTYENTLTTQQYLNNWTVQPAYIAAEQQVQLALDDLNRARSQYNQLTNSPSNNSTDKKAIAAAKRAVRMAARIYQMRQKELDRLGVPTQQELTIAAANTDLTLAKLKDAQNQMAKLANGPSPDDLAAAKAKVQAAQATLALANVVAPFNGTVMQVDNKPGDLVKPGATAFQIEDMSGLFVDLQVSEVDINRVQPGQAASVTFDAVPNQTYTGKVTAISNVSTTSNGAVYYTVTVQITNADAQIKPGMTAMASIAVK